MANRMCRCPSHPCALFTNLIVFTRPILAYAIIKDSFSFCVCVCECLRCYTSVSHHNKYYLINIFVVYIVVCAYVCVCCVCILAESIQHHHEMSDMAKNHLTIRLRLCYIKHIYCTLLLVCSSFLCTLNI